MPAEIDRGAAGRWRGQLARQLARAAVEIEVAEKKALSVPNPPPHHAPARRGEHPRLRTGFGQAGVMFVPTGLEELARTLRVQIGYAAPAFYLAVLGRRGWLWLPDTLESLRPRLAAVFAGTEFETRTAT